MSSSSHPSSFPAPETDEAKVIPFPILSRLKPIKGLDACGSANDTNESDVFEPVLYRNEMACTLQGEDSGLVVCSMDKENDEALCRDFGFDEPTEKDEWDSLYDMIQSRQMADEILRQTRAKKLSELSEELNHNPDAHVPGKGKKSKKGRK